MSRTSRHTNDFKFERADLCVRSVYRMRKFFAIVSFASMEEAQNKFGDIVRKKASRAQVFGNIFNHEYLIRPKTFFQKFNLSPAQRCKKTICMGFSLKIAPKV
jgi:hypothetical protein